MTPLWALLFFKLFAEQCLGGNGLQLTILRMVSHRLDCTLPLPSFKTRESMAPSSQPWWEQVLADNFGPPALLPTLQRILGMQWGRIISSTNCHCR